MRVNRIVDAGNFIVDGSRAIGNFTKKPSFPEQGEGSVDRGEIEREYARDPPVKVGGAQRMVAREDLTKDFHLSPCHPDFPLTEKVCRFAVYHGEKIA